MAELEINNIEEAKEELKKLDPEGKLPKPTLEEVKEAYETFAKAVSDFNNKVFEIGTPERMREIADYLLGFLEKRVFWTKQGWMGVIKLNQEIHETRDKAVDVSFTLGYQALEFTFFALTNVGGIGLSSAIEMEKEAVLFGEITDLIGKQLEAARAELKEIQFLQEKWAAYEQGFYYEREPASEPVSQEIGNAGQLGDEGETEINMPVQDPGNSIISPE
jgi:hypothetical protein